MSRSTIEANVRRAAAILASLPQRLALSHPLPEPLDTLPFQRSRPRPVVDTSSLEELRKELRKVDTQRQEAEQREESKDQQIREFRLRVKEADDRDFEQIVENDQLYRDFQDAHRKVRFLQKKLEEAYLHALAHTPPRSPRTSNHLRRDPRPHGRVHVPAIHREPQEDQGSGRPVHRQLGDRRLGRIAHAERVRRGVRRGNDGRRLPPLVRKPSGRILEPLPVRQGQDEGVRDGREQREVASPAHVPRADVRRQGGQALHAGTPADRRGQHGVTPALLP